MGKMPRKFTRPKFKGMKKQDIRCVRCLAVYNRTVSTVALCTSCANEAQALARHKAIMDSIEWGEVPVEED